MQLHKLETLPAGTRFKFPECGLVGEVVSHGQMGSRVRFEGRSEKQITVAANEFTGRAARTFTLKKEPEIISSGSEVMLWPSGAQLASTPSAAKSTRTRSASPVVKPHVLPALRLSSGTTSGARSESATIAKRTTPRESEAPPRSYAGGSGTRARIKSSARSKRRARTKR